MEMSLVGAKQRHVPRCSGQRHLGTNHVGLTLTVSPEASDTGRTPEESEQSPGLERALGCPRGAETRVSGLTSASRSGQMGAETPAGHKHVFTKSKARPSS